MVFVKELYQKILQKNDEQSEISIWFFSVDHSSTKTEDILNIHQYLMIKDNVK